MEFRKVTPSPAASLRQTLSDATGTRHRRLDAMFEPMLEKGDLQLYRRFLMMNHACHEAIEPILSASRLPEIVPDWAQRSRLAALRLDVGKMALPGIDLPAFALVEPDLPQAVGIAYVVEGSRLGATVIRRQLPSTQDSLSRNYLEGSAKGGQFRNFMEIVSALEWTPSSLERAATAAGETFDYFILAALKSGRAA